MKGHDPFANDAQPVAGNGLLHRRLFLKGAAGGLAFIAVTPAAAEPRDAPPWMRRPGRGMEGYGNRSTFEAHVTRSVGSMAGTVGAGISRTPLEHLEGIITPSALHFERHHNGIPDIDPEEHRLLIHGLVERPLFFDLAALSRYPLVSRIYFIECSGNSGANYAAEVPQRTVSGLHGLVACSEWTGVPVSILLDEAGIKPEGRWILAEGADAAAMSRSVPLDKIMDDALIAIYQNGERLRPGNGYPMRLLLPGWEGNAHVKWLRRIKVTAEPTMTKDETSKYSDLLPDGRARLFTYPMGVKSVITSPSGGQTLKDRGLYQVSGIAWSGAGRIRRVDVSADGGASWAEAELSTPVLPLALTRFRIPWRWDGSPVVLKSRAVDDTGAIQPTRDAQVAERGTNHRYHYHAIQSWGIAANGDVRNVYA